MEYVQRSNPYELLGVAPGAREEEIRSAYRREAKRVHPDVSSLPDAAERFIALQDAFNLLLERTRYPHAPGANGLASQTADPPLDPAAEAERRERVLKTNQRKRERDRRRKAAWGSRTRAQSRRAQAENERLRQEVERRRAERKNERG